MQMYIICNIYMYIITLWGKQSYPYESLVVKSQSNRKCVEKHNQTKCLHSRNKEGE